MRRYPLIVVEGIDGSGKQTQTKLLAEWLRAQGFGDAVRRDFPRYENLTGRLIKGHLDRDWQAETSARLTDRVDNVYIDEMVLQCLMTVNRFEEVDDLISYLWKGPVVLDRYWGSGFAYGAANGLDKGFLRKIHTLLPEPDVCVLVDIPVEESWKRRPERRDRYEAQKTLLERVRANYIELFKEMEPVWKVIDGLGTVDEVQRRIHAVLPKFLT